MGAAWIAPTSCDEITICRDYHRSQWGLPVAHTAAGIFNLSPTSVTAPSSQLQGEFLGIRRYFSIAHH